MKKFTINRMLLNKIMFFVVIVSFVLEGYILFFYQGKSQLIWLSISMGVIFSALVILKATENNDRTHIGLWKLDGNCNYKNK